jgi:hypothetical protein
MSDDLNSDVIIQRVISAKYSQHLTGEFVTRTFRASRFGRALPLVLFAIITGLVLSSCQSVRNAENEVDLALDQIDEIAERIDDQEIYELTTEDLEWLEDEFAILSDRIDNMQDMSSLPLGLDAVAERGSARYRAMMEALEMAQVMAEAGIIVADIGYEALVALDTSGVHFDPASDDETWLDVLERRESELQHALTLIDDALERREQIDEDELPWRVQSRLDTIDAMTDRFSTQLELAGELPLAFVALGHAESQRYLILFQNPAELRPTGGFVGTIAELEFTRGQISHYEFHDIYELSREYREIDEHSIEPPWPIERYIRSDKLQIQDANWWANFPTSAEIILEMTEATGWDPFHGVAAVQPEAVQDLITITGPIEVEVDGEIREITSENVFEESERQRRLQREGGVTETDHKEVIELIGDVLLDEILGGGRDELIDAALIGIENFDRRDAQIFHNDDSVQSFIEERNWAGLIVPDTEIPTLAAVFANVTGLKTSLAMQADMELKLSPSSNGDLLNGELTLGLNHIGDDEADPFYEGFQRWWVDVLLPEDAETSLDVDALAEDPDASNGGSYVISLDVEGHEEIRVEFQIPVTEQLLIRRQPGLLPIEGEIIVDSCDVVSFTGDHDLLIDLAGECPAVTVFGEDETEDDDSAQDDQ